MALYCLLVVAISEGVATVTKSHVQRIDSAESEAEQIV